MPVQNTSPTHLVVQKTFRPLNLLLVVTLSFLTCKKIYAVFALGSLHPLVLTALIVPAVNVYVLYLILQYDRRGYQYLFVLSLLAMIHPENRHLLEMILHAVLIVFSALLYLKMFPRSSSIKASAKG